MDATQIHMQIYLINVMWRNYVRCLLEDKEMQTRNLLPEKGHMSVLLHNYCKNKH